MTRYGFEPDTTALRASWSTGRGPLAATVLAATGLDDVAGVELAEGLEWLSAALWRSYTHPAGPSPGPGAGEDLAPGRGAVGLDGERFQRGLERAAFDTLAAAVAHPQLPDAWGETPNAPTWVGELAHRIGRVLHRAAAGAVLVEAITAEVAREVAAVTAAEHGDLSGRAEQATALSNPDPSPVQVAAADTVLRTDPLAGPEAFAGLDQTAAAVAALHWFAAAVTVTAVAADIPSRQVIGTADDLEALPVPTLGEVLTRLHDLGQRPHEIVVELVAAAQLAGTGQIPDPEALMADYAAALEQIEHFSARGLAGDPGPLLPQRVCLLDPTRPAPDLLEDLLIGINGCLWLYSEHTDSQPTDHEPTQGQDEGDEDGGDEDEGDPDPDEVAAEDARVRALFTAAIIAEATRSTTRLL